MIATGLAFPAFKEIGLLAGVAFFGTVNPSTGDIGVLIPIEHAALAQGAADRDRTRIFARYSLVGALSMAAGALAAATPQLLMQIGMSELKRVAGDVLLLFGCSAFLARQFTIVYRAAMSSIDRLRRRSMCRAAWSASSPRCSASTHSPAGLSSSRCSRYGCSNASTCRLRRRSLFFFWSGLLSAFSYPLAAIIARRIGLVNTMVFTHIPSSLFLMLAALSPNLTAALGLLLLRSALSQMDVPTRSSYVMAVATPPERAAAASVTAVPRSLASSSSPALAGVLLGGPFIGAPLLICGALKIAYDAVLLLSFRHIKPPEEIRGPAGSGRSRHPPAACMRGNSRPFARLSISSGVESISRRWKPSHVERWASTSPFARGVGPPSARCRRARQGL